MRYEFRGFIGINMQQIDSDKTLIPEPVELSEVKGQGHCFRYCH